MGRTNLCGIFLLFLLILNPGGNNAQQLLQNPGFEQDLDGSDWYCYGNCGLTQSTDAHTGLYSGRVSGRTEEWNTVSQVLPLLKDSIYYFEAWVKLLNRTGSVLYHKGQLRMAVTYTDGNTSNYILANQPYMRPGLGWQKLAGDVYIGTEKEIESARLYIQITEPFDGNVEYLVDTTSLTKLIINPDWKTQANNRIEQIRKSDVTINLSLSGAFEYSKTALEVRHTKHKFAFGSAVHADKIVGTDQDSERYRECFYENFYFTVLHNALKWRQMEWRQGEVEYPDEAIQILKYRGYPQRGHCLFWNKEDFVPPWVPSLSSQELLRAISDRLNYTLPRYKGDIIHWDVNNEALSGDLFENITGNVNFMTDLFKEVYKYDNEAILFLNEFDIFKRGTLTQALVNLAEHMRSLGAPLGGIGVQSHLTGSITINEITSMLKRQEVIGDIGLPVWVTELDISGIQDETELADAYDDVITLYFGDPSIDGIILWGFHDENHWRPDAAMFEGPDYEPNESGLRWQEMTRERWRTEIDFFPQQPQETFNFRGFQGNYEIALTYEGERVMVTEFPLDVEAKTVDLEYAFPSKL